MAHYPTGWGVPGGPTLDLGEEEGVIFGDEVGVAGGVVVLVEAGEGVGIAGQAAAYSAWAVVKPTAS
ncbi:MAG: hypothetical protein ACFCVK_18005 [Acidimicrobiales bacterium]